MRIRIVLALFCVYVQVSAQETSNEILPPDVIAERSPSDDALRQIRDIEEKVSTIISTRATEEERSRALELWRSYIVSDGELIVRQYAALQVGRLAYEAAKFRIEEGDSLRRACVQLLEPDDVIWSVGPRSIFFFSNWSHNLAMFDYMEEKGWLGAKPNDEQLIELQTLGKKIRIEYSQRIFQYNPDRMVRAHALYVLLQALYWYEEYETANDYYHILRNDYSDIEKMKDALIEFNPNKALRIGNTVPEFSVQVVKSGQVVSPEVLRGQYYLIHFWSTTCPPCIAEMAELHEIYERFRSYNFAIVSFSVDDAIGNLERFWENKWPMPWYNVLLENGWKDETARRFEVIYIPKTVFVGADGRILENEDTLRTKKLADIIGKYLESKY